MPAPFLSKLSGKNTSLTGDQSSILIISEFVSLFSVAMLFGVTVCLHAVTNFYLRVHVVDMIRYRTPHFK